MYITPCKTGGKCRQLMFQEMGLAWYESYPKHGVVNVWTDKGYGFESFRGRYNCCTKCHLPLDSFEATKANQLYDNNIADVYKPDDDFMELLNGF